MPFDALLWGFALAATAGLRLFMPFLFVGAVARYTDAPAPEMLAWTGSDAGFLILLVATLLEILGDKVPVVDHVLDAGATFLKPVAGLLLPVALLHDVSPAAAWTLGVAAGAPIALGVHATKAGTRAVSSVTTAGVGNPFLSFLEDAFAALILIFTLLAPLFAALLVVVVLALVVHSLLRMRRPRRRAT